MNNIQYYTCYDLPVPYKKLKIYPVTVKDYILFSGYSACLSLDKNSVPDVKIISMSYLDYMFHLAIAEPDGEPHILWLDRILAMCLKDDNSFEDMEKSISRYTKDANGKACIIIGNETYTGYDFNEIRKIICEQNLVSLPDENISKEVRDSLEEAKRYKMRHSGTRPASIEDYIISLSTTTGWQIEYVYSMSIRKFVKSIRRLDNLIHYKIYLSASMSGMVEFKDKSFIKHWLTNIEEDDEYSDVSVDLDKIQGTVSMESAKK